jgi:hypothetical protein
LSSYLKEKSSGFGLENREYGCRDPSLRPRGIIYPQKLAPSSPTSGGHSVGIVCTLSFFSFAAELTIHHGKEKCNRRS